MAIDVNSGIAASDKDEGAAGSAARVDRGDPEPVRADYDVVVIGGGPAGLAAGTFCGRKFLRTAVLEGDSWGGILTRWCPDKRIDNYPGLRPGIQARELADFLLDDARRARVDLIEERVSGISRDRVVRAGDIRLQGKALILATGSTAAEAEIVGEKEFADRGCGVHYAVQTPSLFRGRRVVVVGGGDTAVSIVQRLHGIASRITLVHRQESLRTTQGLQAEMTGGNGVEVLLRWAVAAIF